MKNELLDNRGFLILLVLTLGLAPYLPEPHIWAKLRWVFGGAEGMGAMDYFDLIFHGLPWLLLIRKSGIVLKRKIISRIQSLQN